MEDIILVNVLIPSIGTDVDVELPVSATPEDIINTLLEKEELNIPKEDPNSLSGDSQAIEYKLFKREKNKRIGFLHCTNLDDGKLLWRLDNKDWTINQNHRDQLTDEQQAEILKLYDEVPSWR